MKKLLFYLFTTVIIAAMLLTACAPKATEAPQTEAAVEEAPVEEAVKIDCMGAAEGDTLTVMYQWSGSEEEKINEIFKPLVDACGIEIVAESTRDDAVLDTKVKSTPPDILFWPNVSPLSLYTDSLKDLSDVGGVADSYADFWKTQGMVDGKWLAIPIKADIKSIIWYSPVTFDTFGYEVPVSFEDLDALVEQIASDGNVPWSMGFENASATGWTGSDFIQDLLLAMEGPDYVNGIIAGTIPYDDEGVVKAYETYVKWASNEKYTVGGATGTVSTAFLDAIYKVFSDPPEAMMVKQSGFAGGEVSTQYPDLEYGVDYDFFAFPGAQGMQGGADYMMAFGDSAASQAMVAYLTGEEGGKKWAEVGFDLSPNKNAEGNYADTQLAKKGAALAGAKGFTPDMGDTIGAPFGEAEWKALIDTVQGGDIESDLTAVTFAQATALGVEVKPEIDCMGAAEGDTLTVMYQWSGSEEEKINEIFKPLVDACGIEIVAESTRDDAVLDTKVKSTPPDILFWPNISPLSLYTDSLKDLSDVGGVADNYADFWKTQGMVDGKWLAIPVKADIKSIIWYSPVTFDTFGYEVPVSFEDLDALVEQMASDGNVPWSMGFENASATGWTGSDFIQDLLLAMEGPDYVNGIIAGTIPYDDEGVVKAYETYVKWASNEKYTVGGATGTVSTAFLDAIYKVFSDPPEAMMVKQSGFAGGEVSTQYPDLEYGVDYDFFAFPGAQGMQGGADYMMAFGDSAAAKAMVAYITGPAGANAWAQTGFDLSPNKLAANRYADTQLAKKGAALAGAKGFTPDMGDTIVAPFGEAEWKALIDTVQGGDIPTALAEAAAAQAEALK